MLPTGHFAAGYLTTKLSIAALLPYYAQAGDSRFWVVGILASILTDLDDFYAFKKIGRMTSDNRKEGRVTHRKFISHSPLLHLAIALVGFLTGLLFSSSDLQIYSTVYLVGTWTHFFFDSFAYGIMWLWPFNNRLYAFRNTEVDFDIPETEFWPFWTKFLKLYTRSLVFALEMMVIATAAIVYFL